MRVGFSSLCVNKEITYEFVEDVISEIAAITPGPYFHIGGDEAYSTKKKDYIYFVEKVQNILKKHHKSMIGWEEIAQIDLDSTSIVQHWHSNYAIDAAQKGNKVIMSPASKAYLDMKYNDSTVLGLDWAGLINIKDAYDWEPSTYMDSIKEENIIGIEAPLWSETIETIYDIEYMAFPRILGYAELGWSQKDDLNWEEYKNRLRQHTKRLTKMGVNFYESQLVP